MQQATSRFAQTPAIIKALLFQTLMHFLPALIGPPLYAVQQFAGETGFYLVFILFVLLCNWLFTKWDGRRITALGLGFSKRVDWKNLAVGTLTGFCIYLPVAFVLKGVTGFSWQLSSKAGLLPVSIVCIANFLNVYVQEAAYRGYGFQRLFASYGAWVAQIIVLLFFGVMHIDRSMPLYEIILTMFTTGLGSLLFGYCVIKTGRLALACGVHFGWNILQVLLPRYPVTNNPLFKIKEGSFGSPPSYITFAGIGMYTLFMGLAAIAIHFLYKNKSHISPGSYMQKATSHYI